MKQIREKATSVTNLIYQFRIDIYAHLLFSSAVKLITSKLIF